MIRTEDFQSEAFQVVVMKQLQEKLPRNDFGLPDRIYRPDVLANALASVRLPAQKQDSETDPPKGRSLEVNPPKAKGRRSSNGGSPASQDREIVVKPQKVASEAHTTTGTLGTQVDLLAAGEIALGYLRSEDLEACLVSLSYLEGFPALPDGRPLWSHLEFEPLEVFQAFQEYLDQGRQGVRQLFQLANTPAVGFSPNELQNIFILYSWDVRVRGYDSFWLAERRRMRELRAMDVDDAQYLMGTRLMDVAQTYIDGDEFVALLTPKVAIDLLKQAMVMQRIGVGLPGQGPVGEKSDGAAMPPLEVAFRQIHMSQGGSEILKSAQGIEVMQMALKDEATAATAQELIIRLGQTRNSNG